MITFLFANLVAYSLVYLLIKFRTRGMHLSSNYAHSGRITIHATFGLREFFSPSSSSFPKQSGPPKEKTLPSTKYPDGHCASNCPQQLLSELFLDRPADTKTVIFEPKELGRARTLEDGTIRALEHGPGFSLTVPGIRIVDISKPEWIEHIQKTNFENYVKGPSFRTIMYDVFGDGIFVSDGPAWKRARQATSTIFTVKTFKNIIVPSANKSVDGLVNLLKSTAESNQSINFCDLFFRFTLDSFVQMTFSKDLDLFGTEYDHKTDASSPLKLSATAIPFSAAFDFAQDQASCRVLDDYVYSLIDERMAQLTHQSNFEKNEAMDKDLLSLFMHACDERGGGLGRTELRDTTLNLIIAGRDTTAQALSWAFFHLLMNQDLISIIREEAIEILGDENDDQERVTHENYKRFVWTNAIVLETLRLHPSVPKDLKCAVSHDQIPGGPTVEAGDMVRWSGWQMGRDASLWGPDCGEFKPARWIDEKGSIKQFGPFKFNAFNGGPRICLGMNLAMLQAVKVIVEVFRNFELEFAPGWLETVPKSEAIDGITSRYPTPMYRSSLTLPMDNPMMVSVRCKA